MSDDWRRVTIRQAFKGLELYDPETGILISMELSPTSPNPGRNPLAGGITLGELYDRYVLPLRAHVPAFKP